MSEAAPAFVRFHSVCLFTVQGLECFQTLLESTARNWCVIGNETRGDKISKHQVGRVTESAECFALTIDTLKSPDD